MANGVEERVIASVVCLPPSAHIGHHSFGGAGDTCVADEQVERGAESEGLRRLSLHEIHRLLKGHDGVVYAGGGAVMEDLGLVDQFRDLVGRELCAEMGCQGPHHCR